MDRASDYGSEGWGFESLRARSGPPRCDPPVGVLHFYQALLRECFFHAHPLVVVPASRFSVRSEVTSAQQRAYLSGGATELAQHAPFRSCSAKKFAQRSPSCGVFALAPIMGPSRANFFAHRAQHVATVKPPSPLHPKNAPKTPISRPQRRWRFQTTGPPGRQSLTTAPVGGGWASPRHPWAISVTNVVNPSPKTSIFSEKAVELTTFVTTGQKSTRKTPWIDDVCNNTRCPVTPTGSGGARLRCPWAVAGPGRASRRRAEPHISDEAPLVWRAPEGPEGTGGLRGAAPNEVRPPSLAGGRGLRRPEHPWGYKQSGPAGHPKQNLRNWAASRPTARSAGNAILKSPGHPQCRRRNAPRALPGTTR